MWKNPSRPYEDGGVFHMGEWSENRSYGYQKIVDDLLTRLRYHA